MAGFNLSAWALRNRPLVAYFMVLFGTIGVWSYFHLGQSEDPPFTLRLMVVPETPVAVLHRGTETWLLSSRGRAVKRIPARTRPELPRIWVPRSTPVAAGAFVQPDGVGPVAHALALGARFPGRIATAQLAHGELVLRLRSGLELRLGEPTDVRLKLAIAQRALRAVPAGAAYLDVSVPGRLVAGTQPSSLK